MRAAVTVLVATGRVLTMPKYQLTNPNLGGEEDRLEDMAVGEENSKSLHLREMEWGKRASHFDCWSWWERGLLIFSGGSGREWLERASLGERRRDWRWRRRKVAAAAIDMNGGLFGVLHFLREVLQF